MVHSGTYPSRKVALLLQGGLFRQVEIIYGTYPGGIIIIGWLWYTRGHTKQRGGIIIIGWPVQTGFTVQTFAIQTHQCGWGFAPTRAQGFRLHTIVSTCGASSFEGRILIVTLIRTSVDLTTSLLCEESNASVLETSFLIKSVPSKSTDDKNRRHYSTEAGKTEGSVSTNRTNTQY